MIDENTNEESKVTSINTGREQLMVNFELGTLGSSDKNNTPKFELGTKGYSDRNHTPKP